MSKNGDIIIDLDFVPEWARRPAGLSVHSSSDKRSQRKDGRTFQPRSDRENGRRGAPPDRKRPCDAVAREKVSRAARPAVSAPDASARDADRFNQHRLPIRISFIPERRGLKPIAAWLARTRRAHSLTEVASMFLSKPEFFAVKLETTATEDGLSRMLMYQCAICKAVLLEKKDAIAHALNKHLSAFYEREEVTIDPPKGNFLCVAQCGLSGELLGPPNYHGYNDRMLDLHKTRFSNLSLDEYRKHIVNKTDQALIEQWKQEVCRQVRYRTLQTAEPRIFVRRSDVDSHFIECHAPLAIREGYRFIIPGVVSRSPEGGRLANAVHESWIRENRFPIRMSIAIRPAFRHLGLHIFKTQDKSPFVTAIRPRSVDPAQTMSLIRSILEYLDRYPGCGRQELVEHLQFGALPNAPDVAEAISRLCWLIERGHVIEFSDGKLTVPYRKTVAAELKPT